MTHIVEADYKIPHCTYTANDDGGFTVRFVKPPLMYFYTVLPALAIVCIILSIIIGVYFGSFIILLIVAAVSISALYPASDYIGLPTTITATPEFIIINGKSMRRREFGTFRILESEDLKFTKSPVTLHTLGYSLGNRSFPCGGKWLKERPLNEFASALNSHIRAVPEAGAAPTPSALRDSRQTDF